MPAPEVVSILLRSMLSRVTGKGILGLFFLSTFQSNDVDVDVKVGWLSEIDEKSEFLVLLLLRSLWEQTDSSSM